MYVINAPNSPKPEIKFKIINSSDIHLFYFSKFQLNTVINISASARNLNKICVT